jgi:hypothetical protein
MEVPPVDHRHLDRRAPQRLGGVETAESASDDDHARARRLVQAIS